MLDALLGNVPDHLEIPEHGTSNQKFAAFVNQLLAANRLQLGVLSLRPKYKRMIVSTRDAISHALNTTTPAELDELITQLQQQLERFKSS